MRIEGIADIRFIESGFYEVRVSKNGFQIKKNKLTPDLHKCRPKEFKKTAIPPEQVLKCLEGSYWG